MKKFITFNEVMEAQEILEHEHLKAELILAAINLVEFEKTAGEAIGLDSKGMVIAEVVTPDYEKFKKAHEIVFGQIDK